MKRTYDVVAAELDRLYEIGADDDEIIALEEELESIVYYSESSRYFSDVYYG